MMFLLKLLVSVDDVTMFLSIDLCWELCGCLVGGINKCFSVFRCFMSILRFFYVPFIYLVGG